MTSQTIQSWKNVTNKSHSHWWNLKLVTRLGNQTNASQSWEPKIAGERPVVKTLAKMFDIYSQMTYFFGWPT